MSKGIIIRRVHEDYGWEIITMLILIKSYIIIIITMDRCISKRVNFIFVGKR
jgi:hypothetical protein